MAMKVMAAAGVAALLALCSGARVATAQSAYPSQNVKLIVAFAPAGPADIIARIVGQKLQDRWGQGAVIENRGGAGGNIAARLVAKADADGYTVLVTTSAYAVNPSLSPNAGYSPGSDFKVAAIVATTPNLIVASPNGGISSLADAVARAKTEKLSYATAGVGTTPHLSAERIFRIAAKADIPHVPHTGAGPALNAVMGGHIPLASVALPAAMELVKGGQVKPLAVTSAKRLPALPDVPTTIEAGFGDREDATWVAFFVPAATPPDVIAKLNTDVNAVLADAETVTKLAQIGFAPVGGSQADAASYVTSEIERWAEVIRAIGLKVD